MSRISEDAEWGAQQLWRRAEEKLNARKWQAIENARELARSADPDDKDYYHRCQGQAAAYVIALQLLANSFGEFTDNMAFVSEEVE